VQACESARNVFEKQSKGPIEGSMTCDNDVIARGQCVLASGGGECGLQSAADAIPGHRVADLLRDREAEACSDDASPISRRPLAHLDEERRRR
jgi:hypothetical protein